MLYKEFLQEHYKNILIKNKEKINKGGVIDELLSNVQNDKRMSMVLLIRISPDISQNIQNAINKLKEIENELQKFRELLRNNLSKNNLALEERYKTISFHITIARIKKKLNEPEKFIKFIEENKYFGKMKVESIELCYHNWYDTQKQVLLNIKL